MKKILMMLFFANSAIYATTYTVITTSDNPLSPPSGSLRWAITNANVVSGSPHTIAFNIPTNDTVDGAGYKTQGDWTYWRISVSTPLPTIVSSGTIVDGTSQATFIGGDPNPYGPEIQLWGGGINWLKDDNNNAGGTNGICISTRNVLLRGLAISSFTANGIRLDGHGTGNGRCAENIRIQENYIGLNATGTFAMGNAGYGIFIKNNRAVGFIDIGGSNASDKNVISGNGVDGIHFDYTSATSTIIGNYVGTSADGLSAVGNCQTTSGSGIQLYNANIIEVIYNVISGQANTSNGIFTGDDVANIIKNNYIGTDKNGSTNPALKNTGNGIFCDGMNGSFISSNTIAFNTRHGIYLQTSNFNRISMNSIYGNGNTTRKGIGFYQVSENHGIGLPLISTNSTVSVISGTSVPNAIIEVFKSSVTAGTYMNYGQGKVYLGSTTAGGNIGTMTYSTWTLTLWSPYSSYLIAGDSVTVTQTSATATTGAYDTSEFSSNRFVMATIVTAVKRKLQQLIFVD